MIATILQLEVEGVKRIKAVRIDALCKIDKAFAKRNKGAGFNDFKKGHDKAWLAVAKEARRILKGKGKK